LGDRDEELAALCQLALLVKPRPRLIIADAVAPADERRDEGQDRAAVSLGVQLAGREHVRVHFDVGEPDRA
jgi:hypothetical protein